MTTPVRPIRIAVTGAAGRISYSLLFRIAAGAIFGPNQPVRLSLLDVPEAMPILDATMMELQDGAFPLLWGVRKSADAVEAFAAANWIVMIGSATITPGMSRPELRRANAPIFKEQGEAINEAAPAARILVVANPSNTNCLIAQSAARDVPAEHWFAMMRLDQNRARAMLARKADVLVEQVTRVTAWGNHSPSVYPDFHNAFIDDRPAGEVITDRQWVREVFEPGVAGRGQELWEARGASPAGSAAQAIIASIRSITTPTPLSHRFSAAVMSDGSYAVPRGLFFGFPLRTEDGNTWSIVKDLYLDGHAMDRLVANVAELEHEAAVAHSVLGTRS
jgi:malate dehydrogenase